MRNLAWMIFVVMAAVVLTSGVAAAGTIEGEGEGEQTIVIQPGAEGKDTSYGNVYMTDGTPDDVLLRCGGWSDTYFSFIEFSGIKSTPSSSQIVKVELLVYEVTDPLGIQPNLQLRRVTEPWTEDGVSLANHPSSELYSSSSLLTIGWNTWDITDLYKGWKDGFYTNYGVEIRPTNTNGYAPADFASSDNINTEMHPKLVITFTAADEGEGEILPALIVTPVIHTVDWLGGMSTFTIQTTAAWTAQSNADWATLNTSYGTGNDILNVYCLGNSGSVRTATISIIGIGTNPGIVTVTVNQLAMPTEGEESNEGEGEGESEGEDEACGCCSSSGKILTPKDLFERTLGDWLVIGMTLMALTALTYSIKK